jgi:ketosteroid isomerase-like protein
MSNVDNAKAAYDAFTSDDMERLREMFAEDSEWVSSDEVPNGGTVTGRDAIFEYFATLPETWDEFSVEPEQFIDGGDDVVIAGTQRGSGDGGHFEARYLHLMHFEDGKVKRGEFITDSAKAVKALG